MKKEFEAKLNDMRNNYESIIQQNDKNALIHYEGELNVLREQKQRLYEENRMLNNQFNLQQVK